MYLFAIILYIVLVTGAGIFLSRKKRNSNAFLNAEGDMPWIVNAGTLIATYVGSGAVVGGAALAYSSGYNAIWLYAGGWIAVLVMMLFSKKIKFLAGSTVSEVIGARYGQAARLVASIIIITGEISIVGYNIKSMGWILNVCTGMDVTLAGILCTVVIIGITIVAGLVSVAYTDYFQSIIILISFIIAVPILISTGGGIPELKAALPESYFRPWESLTLTYVFASMVPTFCLNCMSQGYWQRFGAARNRSDLKKSTTVWLFGVVIITILIMTFTTFSAALLPNATGDTIIMEAAKSLLPPAIGVMLLAAVTSVLITTADSFLLSSASVVQNDIYNVYFRKKETSDKKSLWTVRIIVILLGIFAYVLINFFPSILSMVYFAYTMEGGLIVTMIGILFWKRATPQGGLAAVISVFVVTILWEIFKPFGLATVFGTLIISSLVLVVVSLLTPAPDPKYLERFDFSKMKETEE